MLNPNVLNKMSELELLVVGCGDSRVPWNQNGAELLQQ
jgi:carbonic anhydrase